MAESLDAQKDLGRDLRKAVPRSSHGDWSAAPDRPDPVDLIEGQNTTRVQGLLPVRRGRMSVSPFTFYRGAARIMASDLATTASSGLTVQLCGDAHLSNFGVYASPERTLVFDLNDFDETLPGPFEWDVKRLAASFVIAGQHRGLDDDTCRDIAAHSVEAYRTVMARFSTMPWIDAWYWHLPVDDLIELTRDQGASKKTVKRSKKFAKKAKSKNHLRSAKKLIQRVDGELRFRNEAPILLPIGDIPKMADAENARANVELAFEDYKATLPERRRLLVERYEPVDIALKVVGVGSVGTRCWVMLLVGRVPEDVLLLQIKEATDSVLAEHLPASRYRLNGRRVVEGQRMMQAVSDSFLGWNRSTATGHDYYWRQLKDWKGSVEVEDLGRSRLRRYAGLCGMVLARAHAVTGDPAAISGYLGSGDVFDRAVAEFSVRYAEQNRADYEAFAGAISDGRLEADRTD